MCGIAGVARLDGQSLGPESDLLLRRLADILQHRGPDDRELLRDASVGLAFNRLSLVGPADGSQPLVSADGTVVLVANGEVYNYRELAARLPADVRLKTGSDCEVLLYLYQQFGLDFLRDVRGMFAIILWDRAKGQLVLARDRFGIKPLYFHRNDERIVLSSEIKGLFADEATPRRFAWEQAVATPALAAAPRFSAPDMCTWFDGVQSVPAATVLRVDLPGGRTVRHRYWEMPSEPHESDDPQFFVDRYGELLEDSIRECATADTELGLFFSGGVDSASVLAIARTQMADIHTFTALSGGTLANGDAEHAYWLARELGVHNHQVIFDPEHVPAPEEWIRLLWLTETPMTGPEIYYKHELHRFAKQERPELRGMLLGAASDEFNGGYSHDIGNDWESFLRGIADMDRAAQFDAKPALRHWWTEEGSFLSDDMLGDVAGATDVYLNYLSSEYRKVQQYNVWHEDRTAAGSGIEARVPFLDHRVVELTATIPHRLRPRLLWDKQILREAVAAWLPRRIAERPKVPFFYGPGTGYAYQMLVRLMRSNDHELVERALAAPGADGYLDADAIRRRLAGFADGRTDTASVELLMRVVNMGLLAELAHQPPQLGRLVAGPARSALPEGRHPARDTEKTFRRARQYDPGQALFAAKGVLLLTGSDGTWYLTSDGEIEFELDQDSPILRVLRRMDGEASLATVLLDTQVDLDDVRAELDVLLDQQLIMFDN